MMYRRFREKAMVGPCLCIRVCSALQVGAFEFWEVFILPN